MNQIEARASLAERVGALGVRAPAGQGTCAPLPWRSVLKQAAVVWIGAHLAYVAFTYLTFTLVLGDVTSSSHPALPQTLLAAWNRRDSFYYLQIARSGYPAAPWTVYFPLYPMLIRLVSPLTLGNGLASALLVSSLAMYGALVALGLLAAQEAAESVSSVVMRVAVIYPLAFFLAAPYTESLFLMLAAAALLCVRRGSWRWAALWALLAALTRPTGVILFLPLVWEVGRQCGWWQREWWRDGRWRDLLRSPRAVLDCALVIGAVPLAIAGYALVCRLRFGDALAFIHAETYWNHTAEPFWSLARTLLGSLIRTPAGTYWQARVLLDLLPVLAFAAITLIVIRRTPLAFTLYMAGLLFLCVSAPVNNVPDPWVSAGRYLVAAAPVFLTVARWLRGRPALDTAVVSAATLVQAACLIAFLAFDRIF